MTTSRVPTVTGLVAITLVLSFLGLATASTRPAGVALFAASTATAIAAAVQTRAALSGTDRNGATGANLSSAGATLFGLSAVSSIGPDWAGLSIVVAPTCGLAALWWWAHARYDDAWR